MQNFTDHHNLDSRLYQLADELSAGCDTDFDFYQEELEREFQELRITLRNN